jgi:multidrug efflux pump subunit AcrA (membrane-fusion protein)
MKKSVLQKIRNAIFFISLGLSLFLVSCSGENKNDPNIVSGTPAKIIQPEKMNLTEYITLNANTIFLKKEIVRATFQGFIESTYKNIGDKISNGDLLFRINTKESAADTNLQIILGDKTFKGLINIKAKSNGVLTELNYNAGDFVSDGEQIAVISNPSSLRIELNVPYQYSGKINIDTPCEVYLPNDKVVNAFIQKIIPQVDLTAQTQTYILEMKQAENLPENLNVNARIPIRTVKDAIVLPQSAVMSNETLDKFWIMKLINDTTAVRNDITKGIENDNFVQVLKPELNTSDRIISDGAYGLPDTAKVVLGQ